MAIDFSNPRTLLFVPGNQPRMLEKSAGFSAQWLIPDLEDSVPQAEKTLARDIVAEHIPLLATASKFIVPRVNSLSSGLAENDIAAVASKEIIGISIGKISTVDDVNIIEQMLQAAEKKADIPIGHITILPLIETAKGVINAYEICQASDRIRWVAFGAEDFSADMSISRTVDNTEPVSGIGAEPGLTYPRSAVAIAARAAGVHALDTPYTRFRDPEGLKQEASLAKAIGYKGKLSIHPVQVGTIESIFKPSSSEIERARRVLDIASEAETAGRGSASLDGEMIDMPVILRARNVLRDAGLQN
tara:strand:- start:177 stop:1085 length:909 start_codon:yes stop_codon:yes gene_type:complete